MFDGGSSDLDACEMKKEKEKKIQKDYNIILAMRFISQENSQVKQTVIIPDFLTDTFLFLFLTFYRSFSGLLD